MIIRSSTSLDNMESTQNLYKVFSLAKDKYSSMNGYDIKQFSDSIILSAPFSDTSRDDFINQAAYLQLEMLRHGVLTRGGIAVGKHFQSRDFVASQGVIEAYEIEQNISKFPRVVVTDNFLDLAYSDGNFSGSPMARFIDGSTFVDFLRNDNEISVTRNSLSQIWSASDSLPWSAREKISWLIEYWNNAHPDMMISLPGRFVFF